MIKAAVRKLSKGGNVNILKDMSLGTKVNAAGAVVAGTMGYSHARDEGHGVIGSMAKGATDAFLIDLIGWKMYIGGAALMAAPKMIASGYESLNTQAKDMSRAGSAAPFSGNTFVDSEQVYTMRQAGMEMMGQSSHNVKTAVLGNEAQMMHR
jgi:hypothetical protein